VCPALVDSDSWANDSEPFGLLKDLIPFALIPNRIYASIIIDLNLRRCYKVIAFASLAGFESRISRTCTSRTPASLPLLYHPYLLSRPDLPSLRFYLRIRR